MSKTTLLVIIQVYRILGGLMGVLSGFALAMEVLSVGGDMRVMTAWLVVVLTFVVAAASCFGHARYLNKS